MVRVRVLPNEGRNKNESQRRCACTLVKKNSGDKLLSSGTSRTLSPGSSWPLPLGSDPSRMNWKPSKRTLDELRQALEQQVQGDVLVVDAGGSLRCAMLGDQLATIAVDNGWSGIVMYGCIRDSADISNMPVGVKALATHPAKSKKQGAGEKDIPVSFCGVRFTPGVYLYADSDGIVVSDSELMRHD